MTLRLTGPPGKELTLQDWRLYEALFKLHRDRVLEKTAAEERKMIFIQLPADFQRQLIEEDFEHRETRPWVRVRYPPSLSADEVRAAIELHLQEALPVVQESSCSLVCKAKDASQQDRLLELHQARLKGSHLQACPFQYELSSDEIFAFITKRLRAEEELQATLEAYGAQPAIPKPVQVSRSKAKGYAQEVSSARGPSDRVQFSKNFERYPQVCYRCKRAGRLFVHNHKACKFATEEEEGKGKQKKAQSPKFLQHSSDRSQSTVDNGSPQGRGEGSPLVRAE